MYSVFKRFYNFNNVKYYLNFFNTFTADWCLLVLFPYTDDANLNRDSNKYKFYQ